MQSIYGSEIITLDHYKDLPLPMYQTMEAAGFDLLAAIENNMEIKPCNRLIIPTGIKIIMPAGYNAEIRSRSGLAFKDGIIVLNAPGTIDSDFRDFEVKVCLYNTDPGRTFIVRRGDRIAQCVITKCYGMSNVETREQSRKGGFGHTGVELAGISGI